MAGRLVALNISKRFGSVVALDNVSIEFNPGEVHAVLGENGAGKSTLMHVLAGFMTPQSGRLELDGVPLPLGQAHREAGIEMVHQHFTLVPSFTVEENLALSRIDRLTSSLDVKRLAELALSMGSHMGWKFEANAKAASLPVGVQQRVEILKCLAGNAPILIFDEPTAVLSPAEVLDLIRVLKQLKQDGKTVILIAHKLSEVMAVADRVTVLRSGRQIATASIEDVNESMLAEWMVGVIPPLKQIATSTGQFDALTVGGLHVVGDRKEPAVRGVSFEIRAGEIFGVGGVDGNGQVELAETLALVREKEGGSLLWKGQALEEANVRIAYIPQDRQEDGLALLMSVEENLLIAGHERKALRAGPLISKPRVREWVRELIDRFEIKVANPRQQVSDLSGGNQQKIVVSRNLDERPDLLIAVNPTRGLDVRATQFVHQQILSMKSAGVAVGLFTTDLDELSLLSDRVVFMSRGQLTEGQGATSLVGGSA